jgi:hypothetical protein
VLYYILNWKEKEKIIFKITSRLIPKNVRVAFPSLFNPFCCVWCQWRFFVAVTISFIEMAVGHLLCVGWHWHLPIYSITNAAILSFYLNFVLFCVSMMTVCVLATSTVLEAKAALFAAVEWSVANKVDQRLTVRPQKNKLLF